MDLGPFHFAPSGCKNLVQSTSDSQCQKFIGSFHHSRETSVVLFLTVDFFVLTPSLLHPSFPLFPGAVDRNAFALSHSLWNRRKPLLTRRPLYLYSPRILGLESSSSLSNLSSVLFCLGFPKRRTKSSQLCCLQLPLPCTHGDISYQPQFTSLL